MGRAGPSVPRQGGAQARGLLAEPQERTEGWRPGRPRADGLGAALAGAAAGMGAQTKPRAVPSLLNHTRDRPERSVSRPSHASSPASQLLCPSPACHLSSAATISRPLGLFTNLRPRPPPPTPNPRPTHSLTSTCPSGPAHAACARLPASVGRVTCPSVPRGHPVQRRVQTSLDFPCHPHPHSLPLFLQHLFCHKSGSPRWGTGQMASGDTTAQGFDQSRSPGEAGWLRAGMKASWRRCPGRSRTSLPTLSRRRVSGPERKGGTRSLDEPGRGKGLRQTPGEGGGQHKAVPQVRLSRGGGQLEGDGGWDPRARQAPSSSQG